MGSLVFGVGALVVMGIAIPVHHLGVSRGWWED